MDTGQVDPADFARKLEDHDGEAYARVLLTAVNGGWTLHHLWALVGSQPPNWQEETWRYERVCFVACRLPASRLALRCAGKIPNTVDFGQFEATVSPSGTPVTWTRRPSYAAHERLPLPVPVTDYLIPGSDPNRNLPDGMLIGENCPSFPEPYSAWRAFTEGDYSLAQPRQTITELAQIRVAEPAAWIGRVHVTATELTAEILGENVAGTQLELFGAADRSQQQIEEPKTAVFGLSGGLPSSAWLWLKRGHRWLDFRPIDARSGWVDRQNRAPVEIEPPTDPQANIEALIASGEGPHLEFKVQLPEGARDRKMLKGVAAFANGTGGTVIFGVDSDEITLSGLTGAPTALRDQLVNLVRAAVIPTPEVSATPYTIQGKLILVLDIAEGQSPPYGLVTSPSTRDKPEYYVRRGANTYPAQPSDLREAVLRSSTNAAQPGLRESFWRGI